MSTLSLQQFVNYISDFPTSALFSSAVFSLWVSVLISCDSLYSSLTLQSWGQQFALSPPFHRSKKNCWFFSLFSFYLLRRVVTSKLLHAGQNQKSSGCSWRGQNSDDSFTSFNALQIFKNISYITQHLTHKNRLKCYHWTLTLKTYIYTHDPILMIQEKIFLLQFP